MRTVLILSKTRKIFSGQPLYLRCGYCLGLQDSMFFIWY